jgi:hypothetical protein
MRTDHSVVVPSQSDSHIRDFVLSGLTGPGPKTGIAQSQSPMIRSTSVAAALAVLPGETDSPRVIRQYTSIFLVSRAGELWRVYDADAPESIDRQMPSAASGLPCRLFLALARDEQLRVHRFADSESRDIDPAGLQAQLEESVVV